MAHPSARIRGTWTRHLAGRRIILGVAGSIAAVKTVELARALIRHGADVVPVMTPAAAGIITPDALEFATGHKPITALTGAVEHVSELGIQGEADLFLVAPATANTIAKMALGIDDTALTTCAAVALGAGRPVLIAPAMHGPMEDNPPTQRHVDELKERGVTFVRPLYEEGKAKLAAIEAIVAACARALGPGTLAGQRVLVISGGAREPIDPVRVVTNRSSGRMGHAVARAAHRLGADIVAVDAAERDAWPEGTTRHTFSTVSSLTRVLDDALGGTDFDWVLVPAALSDYAPRPAGEKIASDEKAVHLELHRLPKVLPTLRARFPSARIVGWKLQDELAQAVVAARERIERYGVDAIVANAVTALDDDQTEAVLVTAENETPLGHGSKDAIADALWASLAGGPPPGQVHPDAGPGPDAPPLRSTKA